MKLLEYSVIYTNKATNLNIFEGKKVMAIFEDGDLLLLACLVATLSEKQTPPDLPILQTMNAGINQSLFKIM